MSLSKLPKINVNLTDKFDSIINDIKIYINFNTEMNGTEMSEDELNEIIEIRRSLKRFNAKLKKKLKND